VCGGHIHHGRKRILVVNAFNLLITADHKASFVSIYPQSAPNFSLNTRRETKGFALALALALVIPQSTHMCLSQRLCDSHSIAIFHCSACGVLIAASWVDQGSQQRCTTLLCRRLHLEIFHCLAVSVAIRVG
jgi:hypothetical protein